MGDKTSIGDRMKNYEAVPQIKLTPRMPMIIRVDGRAFHTYTRGFNKPWDDCLTNTMNDVAHALMKEVQGAKLAYVQSDEVSVLTTDYEMHETQAWFDKKVQKVCSVAASVATGAFNDNISIKHVHRKIAHFDARCFVIPVEDVNNYFIWRQQDATRNSIQGLAHANFPHKQLQGVSTGQAKEKLLVEKEIDWDELELWKQRGWCVRRTKEIFQPDPKTQPDILVFERTVIESDWDIPLFVEDREYVEKLL